MTTIRAMVTANELWRAVTAEYYPRPVGSKVNLRYCLQELVELDDVWLRRDYDLHKRNRDKDDGEELELAQALCMSLDALHYECEELRVAPELLTAYDHNLTLKWLDTPGQLWLSAVDSVLRAIDPGTTNDVSRLLDRHISDDTMPTLPSEFAVLKIVRIITKLGYNPLELIKLRYDRVVEKYAGNAEKQGGQEPEGSGRVAAAA